MAYNVLSLGLAVFCATERIVRKVVTKSSEVGFVARVVDGVWMACAFDVSAVRLERRVGEGLERVAVLWT